ncbi:MAG: hypothetical protein L6311_13785, partial [Cellulomonas sp.]|nr:hypothetical protein [Cellulomonas sp.]
MRRRPHPSAARALGSVLAGAATCGALLALDPVVAPGGWTTAGVLAVAAAAALVVATVVAAFTTRWLTAPIVRLSATARAFAAGDRS